MAKLQSRCTFVKAFTKQFGNVSFEDVFAHGTWPSRRCPDPAVWDWLEAFFEEQLQRAYLYESVFLDWLHPEIPDEDTLTIEARFVGDAQDPDTEVPAWLAHHALRDKLTELGAATRGTRRRPIEVPLGVDWKIRGVNFGYGSELHTVYNIRATFRISDCRA